MRRKRLMVLGTALRGQRPQAIDLEAYRRRREAREAQGRAAAIRRPEPPRAA